METLPLRKSRFLRIALIIAWSAGFGVADASASARMLKKSAPAYYRITLGEFEITVLSDGTREQPMDTLLIGITKGEVDLMLGRLFQKSPYETSVNCFLINTGTKLIMIDTGAGTLYGTTLGNLMTSLRASGYRPEQIDEVYLTHMHVDHLGGLMYRGRRAFPHATVRADQAEADEWLSDASIAKAPVEEKPFYQAARDMINPYIRVGRFRPFANDGELISGIRSKATHGHTAGHNIYIIESKGKKLEIWGDLLHVAEVQFLKPEVAIDFDDDSANAIIQRRARLADATATESLIGCSHVSFPGLGHVRVSGNGFVWIPISYSVIH